MILLVAGPSGVGKSRLVAEACRSFGFSTVVPVTTRAPRQGEVDGREYEFVTVGQFQDDIRSSRLYCWDYVLGNYYGYRHDLEQLARSGTRLLVQILARMGVRVAATLPDAHLLFLDASGDRDLEHRLVARKGQLDERRTHWAEERLHSRLFDFTIQDAAVADPADLARFLSDLVNQWE